MSTTLPTFERTADRARLAKVYDRLAEPFELAAERLGRHDEILTIAGVRIRLSFAGTAMRERLLPALTSARDSGEADVTLRIWDCVSAALPAPDFPWRAEDLGPRGAIDVATGDLMRAAFTVGSSALSMLDLERGLGLFRARDARELPWYERAAPFRTLLHWILEWRGCRFVHAAAVATEHGGALLAGRGGSGKSTTAMLCVERGFAYAGDDYVGITTHDGPRAHAIFTSAKLSAASIAWLPFLRSAIRVAPDGEEKGVAMLGDVVPQQLASTFPLRAIIVPHVQRTTRAHLRRIPGGEALRALAPTTLLQLPGNGADAFADLADLVRGVPAWSLALDDDRAAIPLLVARAIEESR
jgi:hypothetical protein